MNKADRLQIQWQSREANKEARQEEMDERTRAYQLRVERYKKFKEVKKLAGPDPLNLHAIGDSWFDYWLDGNILLPPFSFGIVADSQLGSKGNPNPFILSRAYPGQASTAVLTWEKQSEMVHDWTASMPDAILVSMGGDDIAGDQLAIFLSYGGGATKVSNRFQGVLDSVRASYTDLFALRDLFAKNVPIFGHCYDYALPNGTPALFFGPWLKPSFDFAYYSSMDAQQVVVDMIDKFHNMLNDLASDPKNNFYLVDTTNTIAPNNTPPDGWANELHPYTPGFGGLADKFVVALRGKFPGRI